MARVHILETVDEGKTNDWCLCFQLCVYLYDDRKPQNGYRFIWRRPDGTLQAARGQARLPTIARAQKLMARAIEDGWGNRTGPEDE